MSNTTIPRLLEQTGRIALLVLANLQLLLIPYPVGLGRRLLIGSTGKNDKGVATVYFSSQPIFASTCHLIFTGWLVGLAVLYNLLAADLGWVRLPVTPVIWAWLLTLILAVVMMGFNVHRVLPVSVPESLLGVLYAV